MPSDFTASVYSNVFSRVCQSAELFKLVHLGNPHTSIGERVVGLRLKGLIICKGTGSFKEVGTEKRMAYVSDVKKSLAIRNKIKYFNRESEVTA